MFVHPVKTHGLGVGHVHVSGTLLHAGDIAVNNQIEVPALKQLTL